MRVDANSSSDASAWICAERFQLLKYLMMFCFVFCYRKKTRHKQFYCARIFFIDFKEILQGYSNLKCICCSLSSDKHRKERERERIILSPASQCEEWLEETLLGWLDISHPVCRCHASAAAWLWGYKALVEGKHKGETQGRSHAGSPLFLTVIWSDGNARPAGNIWGSVWVMLCPPVTH